jgi:hypothetical protein
MVNKLLIIIVTILCSEVFGQSLKNLDEKNGFKEIKLGSSFESYKSSTTFLYESDDKSKLYLYTGECCKSLFNYPLDSIFLRFQENKIVCICLATSFFRPPYEVYEEGKTKTAVFRPDDFESIKNSFEQLFGNPTSYSTSENSFNSVSFTWKSDNVDLTSIYQNFGIKGGDRNFIIIFDRKYLNKLKQSGF